MNTFKMQRNYWAVVIFLSILAAHILMMSLMEDTILRAVAGGALLGATIPLVVSFYKWGAKIVVEKETPFIKYWIAKKTDKIRFHSRYFYQKKECAAPIRKRCHWTRFGNYIQ